jgi:hypothetical protein
VSHYHCEIVLPPRTPDIEAAIATVLKPFREDDVDEDGHRNPHAFYDYYVIGGRYSGAHIEASMDPAKMERFYALLVEAKITVSGVQFGKQTLQPASQQDAVDRLWRETFPESGLETCPLFDHFPVARYDACTLDRVPAGMRCGHFIVAGPPGYPYDGKATYMLRDSIWNGVTWQDTTWDGTFGKALTLHAASVSAHAIKPAPDSIVVTVDYHS